MYEKTAKSAHYLPRKGSYSTVPHRNGRVDILPPDAQLPLYSIAVQISDGEEQVGALRERKKACEAELHALGRIDLLRDKVGSRGSEKPNIQRLRNEISRLEESMRAKRRWINELKAILSNGQKVSFEDVFVRLARVELPQDIYQAIESKARLIVSRASTVGVGK